MIFRFAVGSGDEYAFELNEATVYSHRRTRKYSRRGRRQSTVHTLQIGGRIKRSSNSDLNTALAELESAFESDLTLGSTAGLYYNDGTTRTTHYLDSLGTVNGIQVVQLSYDQATGAELVLHRHFSIVLQCEYVQTGIGSPVLEWSESLRHVGNGGPRVEWTELFSGPPQPTVVSQMTMQYLYQIGHALGFTGYVTPPNPIFPAYELNAMRQITPIGPTGHPMGHFDYGIQWQYVMALPTPGSFFPNAY